MRIIALALAATGLLVAGPAYASSACIETAVADTSRSEANRALDESRKPAAVLEFSDINSGDVVADFMAGGGYYTEMIAGVVGKKGRVYAINPNGFHNAEAWVPISKRHPNIRTMPVEPRQMMIAPSSVDTIFTHLVFHDLYWESEQYKFPKLDVEMVLANWFAGVKSGGTVIVVDHAGPSGDPREITTKLHRIDSARVISDMTKAGFVLDSQSDMLRRSEDDGSVLVFDPSVRGKTDRFVMKFRKP